MVCVADTSLADNPHTKLSTVDSTASNSNRSIEKSQHKSQCLGRQYADRKIESYSNYAAHSTLHFNSFSGVAAKHGALEKLACSIFKGLPRENMLKRSWKLTFSGADVRYSPRWIRFLCLRTKVLRSRADKLAAIAESFQILLSETKSTVDPEPYQTVTRVANYASPFFFKLFF